jgi:glycosyltransferase involved in cell wall biosynthesis
MKWAYGWGVYKSAHANDPKKVKWMDEINAAMEDADIENLGKLSQKEVGKLYQQASFLAYPSEFAEIDCISVKKAQAAKCAVVATDFGAFPESVEYGLLIHSEKNKTNWNKPYQFHFGLEDEEAQDEWVEAMVSMLKSGYTDWDGLEEWKAQYEWSEIARRWNEILCA